MKIFVETTLAQNRFQDYPDSLKFAKESILQKYSVTSSDYEKEIKNTKASAEFWDAFFKEAKTYLDSLRSVSDGRELP